MRGVLWPGNIFAKEDVHGVLQHSICAGRVQRGRSAGAVLTMDVEGGFFLASDAIEVDVEKALPPARRFAYDSQLRVFADCDDVRHGHIRWIVGMFIPLYPAIARCLGYLQDAIGREAIARSARGRTHRRRRKHSLLYDMPIPKLLFDPNQAARAERNCGFAWGR